MSKTTKSVSENKPPEWAKPLFEESADEAMRLYNQNKGFSTYTGDRVADLTNRQTDAINQMYAAGRNPNNPAINAATMRVNDLSAGQGGPTDLFRYDALFNRAAGNDLTNRMAFTADQIRGRDVDIGNALGVRQDYNQILNESTRPSRSDRALDNIASGAANVQTDRTENIYADIRTNPSVSQGVAGGIASGRENISSGQFINVFNSLMTNPTYSGHSLAGVAYGAGRVDSSALRDVYADMSAPSAAERNLSGLSSGSGGLSREQFDNLYAGLTQNPTYSGHSLAGMAYGTEDVDSSALRNIYQSASAPSMARQSLGDVASGTTNLSRGQFDNIYAGLTQNPTYSGHSLAGIAYGGGDVDASRLGQIADRAAGTTASDQYLTAAARGDNLYGDSLFQEMLDKESQKIADQVGSSFSRAGRYGSGANQSVLAESVGDFRRGAILDNYAAERQRQLQAVNQIDSARNQSAQTGISAASAGANIGLQNLQNRMAAAGQIDTVNNQRAQTALDAASRAGDLSQQNIQNRLAAVGQIDTADNQRAQTAMGAAQGDINTRLQNLQNRMSAAGQIDSANNQRTQTALDAASRGADLSQQNILNRLAATGQIDAAAAQRAQAATGAAQADVNTQLQNLQNQMAAAGQIDAVGDRRMQTALDAQQRAVATDFQNRQMRLDAARQSDDVNLAKQQAALAAANQISGVQNQNLQNRMAAAGQIDSVANQQMGNRLAAAQGLTGIEQLLAGIRTGNADRDLQANIARTSALGNAADSSRADIASALTAQGALNQTQMAAADQRLAASNALAQLGQQQFQNELTGAQAALGAGTIQQQQNQQEMDARMAEWMERDMEDWTRLGALQAAASGAAGPYGTGITTTRQPFNPLGILGLIGGFV